MDKIGERIDRHFQSDVRGAVEQREIVANGRMQEPKRQTSEGSTNNGDKTTSAAFPRNASFKS